MLREDYLRAAYPDRHTVLGVSLRDYSIGHDLLLERIRSPFVVPGRAGADDLFIALLICSMDAGEAAELLNQPDLTGAVADFAARQLRAASKPARWWQPARALNPDDYIAAFARYVGEAKQGWPGLDWNKGDSSEVVQLSSHPLHVICITLMSELHFTEREALEMPYARAHWHYVTHFEQTGKASLFDRVERAKKQTEANAMAEEFHAFLKAGGRPQAFVPTKSWASN
ncbi:MAG: hypothetical protein EB141_10325 [Verrucomicrobia bacterium]|nr:hypothetical protein [Pseudomonadota bacterium]NDB76022.1 hypothetical protein [Verrucomicrobiota bacterium]